MNALQALCAAGGTVRITVFRAYQKLPEFDILANVIVSCAIIDPSELVPINIFTVKGTLKKFTINGVAKFFLNLMNSRDPEYPNFWFGTGFGDYINACTIKKFVDLLPETPSYPPPRNFIEFRVLPDGAIENVDTASAFRQKRDHIADCLEKIAKSNHYVEQVEGEQASIESIIGVTGQDSVVVQ